MGAHVILQLDRGSTDSKNINVQKGSHSIEVRYRLWNGHRNNLDQYSPLAEKGQSLNRQTIHARWLSFVSRSDT